MTTDPAPPAAPAETPELFCPDCGYSLRGIDASSRCPECGFGLDRARLTASNIPWTHRGGDGGGIGAFRAYWRTVRLVILHPTRAAGDVARPVSFDDARRFRRATALIATTGPLALLAWACVAAMLDRPITLSASASPAVRIGWLLEILLVPVIVVALYAFFLAATGVASYFFHPKRLPVELQNRAVAISYYACAPWALTPLTVASVVAAWLAREYLVSQRASATAVGVVLALGATIPLVQAVAMTLSPLRMLQRATNCGLGRAFLLGTVLPVLWALLAIVIAVGIPAAYVFTALVILSLIA